MGVSSPRLGLSPRSLPSPRSRSFVRGLALGILPALLMLCSGGGGGWAHWAARHAGVPPPGRAGGRVQLEASQPIGALAPHHQLVAQQLYGLAGDPGGIAYLDLLDDAGLAPLTKATQRWIYQRQHPGPASCAQQQYLIGGADFGVHLKNGLGSLLHIAGEELSAALQRGRLFVWHAEAGGARFADAGCGRGEPHTNLECFFQAPSSCGVAHATANNSQAYRWFYTGERGRFEYEDGPPPHLVALLTDHFAALNVELRPDFLRYWWKAQSAAYLARPNAATRAELARLRARPDMFVYLTERQQGQVGERQALRVPFPLPPGSIHIHVRHGRKAGEMELVALATYVKAAEHWLVNFNPLAYKKFAFLSSDDTDVFRQAARVTNFSSDPASPDSTWTLVASNDPRVEAGGQEWDLALLTFGQQQTTTRHLLNLFVALEADAWVGTRGSNWDRLVDELRCVWVDKCTGPYLEAGPPANWQHYNW